MLANIKKIYIVNKYISVFFIHCHFVGVSIVVGNNRLISLKIYPPLKKIYNFIKILCCTRTMALNNDPKRVYNLLIASSASELDVLELLYSLSKRFPGNWCFRTFISADFLTPTCDIRTHQRISVSPVLCSRTMQDLLIEREGCHIKVNGFVSANGVDPQRTIIWDWVLVENDYCELLDTQTKRKSSINKAFLNFHLRKTHQWRLSPFRSKNLTKSIDFGYIHTRRMSLMADQKAHLVSFQEQ